MKKILADKSEGIAEIIDKVVSEPDDEVTVVIPKDSVLARSARNFHLLRSEADTVGKRVDVESVDESILALANDAGLGSAHPLLRKPPGSVSDIVSVSSERTARATVVLRGKKDGDRKRTAKARPEPLRLEPTAIKIEVTEEEAVSAADGNLPVDSDAEGSAEKSFFSGDRFFSSREIPDDNDSGDGAPPRSRRMMWISIAAAVAIVVVLAIVTEFFGSAQITIDFQKTTWTYAANFTGNTAVAKPSAATDVIPAQMFTENKNVTETFIASGSSTVQQRATGVLTIYNAYSAAPQDLVATTRFVTPAGQIFRLEQDVTVPGAQVTNGQISPSSINTEVVADAAGPDYNGGPVAKLTIPGFQNSPKYDGFYGTIASGTAGGFIGNKPVPTAQDIKNAEASTTAVLEAALQNTAGLTIPSNFKILAGATSIQIGAITVNTSTDANGNFTAFGQATYRAIGFDESALKTFLLTLAQTTEQSSTFSTLTLTYGSATPNFTDGTIAFPLSVGGSLEPAFSPGVFASSVAGEGISGAKAAVAALPNLQDGRISVWPVWLWKIPADSGKIFVTVH